MKPTMWRWLAERGGEFYPFTLLIISLAVLALLPVITGATVGVFNFYNMLQFVADYGPVVLALGLIMILKEYDISTAGGYAAGGIVAVTFGQESPVAGIAAAMILGLAAGAIQGLAVAVFTMNSVPVTLGGYMTLVGLAYVIAHDVTVPYDNFHVGLALNAPVLGVFSLRSILVLGAFVVAAILMRWTTLGAEVRAVGGDRRGARIAGVPVRRILFGSVVVAGGLSALGGAMSAFGLSSANPDIGIEPLLIATVAVLLGGVSLSGGKGSVWGMLAGIGVYAVLRECLAVLGTESWLSDVVTGGLLALVTITTAPDLRAFIASARSRWRSASVAAVPHRRGDRALG